MFAVRLNTAERQGGPGPWVGTAWLEFHLLRYLQGVQGPQGDLGSESLSFREVRHLQGYLMQAEVFAVEHAFGGIWPRMVLRNP